MGYCYPSGLEKTLCKWEIYVPLVTKGLKCIVCISWNINHLNSELNPICHLLALLGAHHFLHVNRIRVKSLTHDLSR